MQALDGARTNADIVGIVSSAMERQYNAGNATN